MVFGFVFSFHITRDST